MAEFIKTDGTSQPSFKIGKEGPLLTGDTTDKAVIVSNSSTDSTGVKLSPSQASVGDVDGKNATIVKQDSIVLNNTTDSVSTTIAQGTSTVDPAIKIDKGGAVDTYTFKTTGDNTNHNYVVATDADLAKKQDTLTAQNGVSITKSYEDKKTYINGDTKIVDAHIMQW
jgi:hypothetical protein